MMTANKNLKIYAVADFCEIFDILKLCGELLELLTPGPFHGTTAIEAKG